MSRSTIDMTSAAVASARLARARRMVTTEQIDGKWRVTLHASRAGGPVMTVHEGEDEDRARKHGARLVLLVHAMLAALAYEDGVTQ